MDIVKAFGLLINYFYLHCPLLYNQVLRIIKIVVKIMYVINNNNNHIRI